MIKRPKYKRSSYLSHFQMVVCVLPGCELSKLICDDMYHHMYHMYRVSSHDMYHHMARTSCALNKVNAKAWVHLGNDENGRPSC